MHTSALRSRPTKPTSGNGTKLRRTARKRIHFHVAASKGGGWPPSQMTRVRISSLISKQKPPSSSSSMSIAITLGAGAGWHFSPAYIWSRGGQTNPITASERQTVWVAESVGAASIIFRTDNGTDWFRRRTTNLFSALCTRVRKVIWNYRVNGHHNGMHRQVPEYPSGFDQCSLCLMIITNTMNCVYETPGIPLGIPGWDFYFLNRIIY